MTAITSLTLASFRPGLATESRPADAAAGGFGALVADGLREASRSLQAAEQVSVAGLTGAATTQQVVEAVMSAEQHLQFAVGVRDKIVAAYLEVSRMQI